MTKSTPSWDVISNKCRIEKVGDRQAFSEPPRHHPQNGNYSDEEYLAWVRTLPCTACGRLDTVEAHHHWKTRNNDYTAIPLCKSCHQFGIHVAKSRHEWEAERGLNLEQEIMRHLMLYVGILKGII